MREMPKCIETQGENTPKECEGKRCFFGSFVATSTGQQYSMTECLTPNNDNTASSQPNSQLQSTIRSFLPNLCEFIWKYIFIHESAKKSPEQQFEHNMTMSAAITMTVDSYLPHSSCNKLVRVKPPFNFSLSL
jgi:hypothetical protein